MLIIGCKCKQGRRIIRAEIMNGQVLKVSKSGGAFDPPCPSVPPPLLERQYTIDSVYLLQPNVE